MNDKQDCYARLYLQDGTIMDFDWHVDYMFPCHITKDGVVYHIEVHTTCVHPITVMGVSKVTGCLIEAPELDLQQVHFKNGVFIFTKQ